MRASACACVRGVAMVRGHVHACAVFVCVCVLQLVHGLALRDRKSGADMRIDPRELQLQDELAGHTYMEVMLRPVPVQYFTEKMQNARTYHDILRIFYGDFLSNANIDSIISTQPLHPQTYGTIMGRPRIGGLSDTMAFSVDQPTLEGIFQRPSVMLDSPQTSSPKPSLQLDPSGARVALRHHRRKQRKRKDRKANRRKKKGKGDRVRKSQRELVRAEEHLKEMTTSWECRLPVPEVIRIRDVNKMANLEFFPQCTTLYRCRRDAGCCNATSECAPKTNSTIHRSFFVLEYVGGGKSVQPSSRKFVQTLTFLNHTECECKPVRQLPHSLSVGAVGAGDQCLDCPRPFYPRRANKTECVCDCFDRHHTCLKIKKGRRPLDERDLRCIKEGKCHVPKCQYGLFDDDSIKTGFCPRADDETSGSTANFRRRQRNG